MASEAIEVTLQVVETFELLGIRYLIGGSMASAAHGHIRATLDVDLLAEFQNEHINPLIERLGDAYYADPHAIKGAIARGDSFNLIHIESMFKVDVFIAGDRPFNQEQLARRREQLLEKSIQESQKDRSDDL